MFPTSHIHPMLVHFPIALVAVGFVAELAAIFIKKETCLPKVGFYLLLLGTISAIAALLAGALFTSEMSGATGEVRETHELFASLTVVTLVLSSIVRFISMKRNNEQAATKWLAFALYGLAAVFVGITGFFGGNLVFNYMMPL